MGFTCYWMLEVSVGATKAAGKVWIYRGGTLASDPDNRRQTDNTGSASAYIITPQNIEITVGPNFPFKV